MYFPSTPFFRVSQEKKMSLLAALGLQPFALSVPASASLYLFLSQLKEQSPGKPGPEFLRCHWNEAIVQRSLRVRITFDFLMTRGNSFSLWLPEQKRFFSQSQRNTALPALERLSCIWSLPPAGEFLTTLSSPLQWFSRCLHDRKEKTDLYLTQIFV